MDTRINPEAAFGGRKRIALIGYDPAEYFRNFAEALEAAGFEVFWVHITRGAAEQHRKLSFTPDRNILDTTAGFDPRAADAVNTDQLSLLECAGAPRLNDIIRMDRILRHKPYAFALRYLDHLRRVVAEFLQINAIALVSSGRDSALQLTSMLVCRRLAIPWVVPTRLRIPRDMYMFCTSHETASIAQIRTPSDVDRKWAEEFIAEFRRRSSKPWLKASAPHFGAVVRMLPKHACLFHALVKKASSDKGNDYSRYTISHVLRMYVRRRINLMLYRARPPYSGPGDKPFCLYALHTQPESSIDVAGAYFSDQTALIGFISRSLPVSHELYVKIHPSDVDGKAPAFYRQIATIPGVRLIAARVDSAQLIQRAAIVFTLTGTIGYEAALAGKAVVTFARNYFNDMPTVHYCDAPPQLPALVDMLLAPNPPEDGDERLIAFLANLKAQSFSGEVNRMYLPVAQPLIEEDLRSLQQAYQTLYDVLVLKPANPRSSPLLQAFGDDLRLQH